MNELSKNIRIFLLQIDGPSEPTEKSVRQFLKNFLSSRRIVDMAPILWLPILYGIILPRRSKKVAKLYERVFAEGKSNLRRESEQFLENLKLLHPNISIELLFLGNERGNSEARALLETLPKSGERWEILPLYPQYSTATYEYLFDNLKKVIGEQFNEIVYRNAYHLTSSYAKLCAQKIQNDLAYLKVDHLLVSFHSMPIKRIMKGDLYLQHVMETYLEIKEELSVILNEKSISLAYQSKFKSEGKWLSPFVDDEIYRLKRSGVVTMAIFPASFLFDCLETTVELGQELKESAAMAGVNLISLSPLGQSFATDFPLLEKIGDKI